MSKESLSRLADHIEMLGKIPGIAIRLKPGFIPGTPMTQEEVDASERRTEQAVRVLRAMAPFEIELREFLIQCRAKKKPP